MHTFSKRHVIVALFATMTIAMAWSCSGGVNMFPKSEDVTLGNQMAAKIAADPKDYPILNNPTLTAYLQSIEDRIAQSPNVQNKDFHYRVQIINDPKTINAFTIPGGGIYVYTGLLKFINDESALAGVLAHETTHADHRHATRNMTQQYGLEALTAMVLGSNAGLIAQAASNVGTNLTVLKFSRDDETEADQGSFDDLNQLPGRPWWPGGVNLFLTKSLSSQPNQPGAFQQLFLTHPVDQNRINAINADIKKSGMPTASAAQLNTNNYARYKAMLP